jgi:hypothetical protein
VWCTTSHFTDSKKKGGNNARCVPWPHYHLTKHIAAPAFLLGAAFGYMGGLVHRWRTDVMEAKEAMIRYPALMEHHIRDAIPCELKRVCAFHSPAVRLSRRVYLRHCRKGHDMQKQQDGLG